MIRWIDVCIGVDFLICVDIVLVMVSVMSIVMKVIGICQFGGGSRIVRSGSSVLSVKVIVEDMVVCYGLMRLF